MRKYRPVVIGFAFLLLSFHATAQTPTAAKRFFERGVQDLGQGNLDAAVED